MGKKNTDPVHIGKRKWWSGDVVTRCGLRWKPENAKQESWLFNRITCQACKDAEKRGVWL